MGSGSSVAVSGWEAVSPSRQQELVALHADLMSKDGRQENDVVVLLTMVEWQRLHCSSIRPANAIKYSGMFVDNGVVSVETLGMKVGSDKDWLEGTLGMDMFDSEELVDALKKHNFVKKPDVSSSSSSLPTVSTSALPTTPLACIEALTTAIQAISVDSISPTAVDVYSPSMKNALKGIEIVARGNPAEQEELGAGGMCFTTTLNHISANAFHYNHSILSMIGVCDLLLQLLSKAAIDHVNLAEGHDHTPYSSLFLFFYPFFFTLRSFASSP